MTGACHKEHSLVPLSQAAKFGVVVKVKNVFVEVGVVCNVQAL